MSATRTQLKLSPNVLRWARERAGLGPEQVAEKLKVDVRSVAEWEESGHISVASVHKLAKSTYTPLGFLYLPDPPDESLPIHDFRTHRGQSVDRPSPELMDTIYSMLRRQNWLRDELIESGAEPLRFVNSATINTSVDEVAQQMRIVFGLSDGWASNASTWDSALRDLREFVEESGIIVVFNGVVANNTSRRLIPEEFRGFALMDEYAPLVFVNSTDFKSAQLFTLVHECAHLWIGVSGVSNFETLLPMNHRVEIWCNAVAAEFLAPRQEFLRVWESAPAKRRLDDLAVHFKVSRLVIARRALDFNLIDQDAYEEVFERSRMSEKEKKGTGGHFWNTQNTRIGERFGSAVASAVREGRLSYRDASRLTDLGTDKLEKYIQRLGY